MLAAVGNATAWGLTHYDEAASGDNTDHPALTAPNKKRRRDNARATPHM
jgi:hypothetical protein